MSEKANYLNNHQEKQRLDTTIAEDAKKIAGIENVLANKEIKNININLDTSKTGKQMVIELAIKGQADILKAVYNNPEAQEAFYDSMQVILERSKIFHQQDQEKRKALIETMIEQLQELLP